MAKETKHKRSWYRLDNAALIFPASLRKNWSNAFRISFSFTDPVDPDILQEAAEALRTRFPSVFVRLERSMFWYYLQEVDETPKVREDTYQPLIRMDRAGIKKCAIRILYYRERMAVEVFHSVTDGTGAMVFAKNLAAEYVRRRYHVNVPNECGLKDLSKPPTAEELEDSFQKYAGPVSAPRDDLNVFRYKGTPEDVPFLHVTCGVMDAEAVHQKAKSMGVTITAFLTALLIECLLDMQAEKVRKRHKRKMVRVQIPVNLRQLYGSETMRNFVAVANIGVDPRMGDYTFEELTKIVHHQMQLSITAKNMSAIFTPNVVSERNPLIRIVPLFLKNIIMRMVFDAVGENVSCLSISNLGNVQLPKEMAPFVTRAEFVLGPQSTSPYNCSATSVNGRMFFNIVRNSVEPELERRVFTKLVKMGLHVKIESNGGPVQRPLVEQLPFDEEK
ncbi:MAG: hypothetical protein II642_00310 [Firmicutes bacterium]|nr:hypothetical protein [Bacillota bacterium]